MYDRPFLSARVSVANVVGSANGILVVGAPTDRLRLVGYSFGFSNAATGLGSCSYQDTSGNWIIRGQINQSIRSIGTIWLPYPGLQCRRGDDILYDVTNTIATGSTFFVVYYLTDTEL